MIDRLAAYGPRDRDRDRQPRSGRRSSAAEPSQKSTSVEDVVASVPSPDPVVVVVVEEPGRGGNSLSIRQASQPPEAAKPAEGRKEKRAKKLVGLKIGASQIAAAQVVNNGAPELVEVFREPLEPGLVVSGEIRDPDALGDALKRFFELHKLPKRGIRLGVSNNRIGVRIFEIEGVSDPRSSRTRFASAPRRCSRSRSTRLCSTTSYSTTRRARTAPSGGILLVVAYREVVDRYLQACRGAGLQLVGIDLEAFALLRSLGGAADREVTQARSWQSRSATTGRRSRSRPGVLRVRTRPRLGRVVAQRRDRAGADRAPSEVEAIKRQLSFAQPRSTD